MDKLSPKDDAGNVTNPDAIRYVMVFTVCGSYVLCAFAFWTTAFYLDGDMRKAKAEELSQPEAKALLAEDGKSASDAE